MLKDITIGLVVPFAEDTVPFEGPLMCPGVKFIARGVGVRNLTPEGYQPAWDGIIPAADYLAKQNVDAIMASFNGLHSGANLRFVGTVAERGVRLAAGLSDFLHCLRAVF